jgi:crotonobetainyl-CoA:carnitine CoA-transferase CaiB-like acyl-CoA transferase
MTASQLLDDLMKTVGEEPASRHVDFIGNGPGLPVPLRVGELGASAIAAGAVQAARLWQMRTGRMQSVRLAIDAATCALGGQGRIRQETESGVAGPSLRELRRASRTGMGSRILVAKDGRWLFLHREFPHHRERIESVLGTGNDEASISAAVAKWDAFELEEAVFAAGACAAAVRTYSEWDAHEPARVLDKQPLVEILKIGDSPPEPLVAADRPLGGIRVLDLTRVIAGPVVARTLAEHGAQVLRICTDRIQDNEVQSMETGHGKRSTVLDLTREGDAAQLIQLVKGADVFSQSYRPGSFARRGFSPEALASIRPGIIYVTVSAWSHEGPWRERRGFESVVQNVSGITDDYRFDGQPRLMPANTIDYGTGYLGAFGAMVALGRRAREGGSYLVRVALARTGRWITHYPHVSKDEQAGVQPIPPERVEQLMVSTETPFGRLRHLGPVAEMSETPPRWTHPTVPTNNDAPIWA